MKKFLVVMSALLIISIVCLSITFAVPLTTVGNENIEAYFVEGFVGQYPDPDMARHIYENITLGDCLVCYASEVSGIKHPEYLEEKFERLFITYIIQDAFDTYNELNDEIET